MKPFRPVKLYLITGISFISLALALDRGQWVLKTLTPIFVEPSLAQVIYKDAPYLPSSNVVVQEMLRIAQVTSSDVVYDLGSGDGRIVISAAKNYGAKGVGIDIDPKLIQEAKANAREAGVSDRVKFIEQDFFKADLSEATVVTLYLLSDANLKLRPKLLQELKPGTRIVSHAFNMGTWKPEQVVTVTGGSKIYYWIVPEQIPQDLLSN
ncbi:SAM-dependent methyltransferase [Gloeothece verrucosa]|uniref:Methyltransferase type 11 n=1 Tax=Gloeothece verrucosa (strain PCC 7822) TaxID=497965 RepID=E0UKL1_GLOV7|nr:class I SAM-dependent methyltransferase [Gloeothece verrucosa]ADN17491.1 Methyltransferase type 11 [Gloeothece verrucosa PCC 7822]